MKQYSADLRKRLLGAIDGGLPWPRPPDSSASVPARSSAGGGAAHHGHRGGGARPGRPRASVPRTLRPCGPGRCRPDATLAQHCARWATEQGVAVSVTTIRGSSTASGSRSKKVLHARERDEAERAAWWAETTHLDPAARLCRRERDECGDDPRYGRAPRGQWVVGVVPRNHGPNVTCWPP